MSMTGGDPSSLLRFPPDHGDHDHAALALASVRTRAHLRGMLLEVTIEQSFRNTSAQTLRISPSFLLPDHAVLLGLDAILANRQHLRAQIADKHTASFQQIAYTPVGSPNDDDSVDVLLEGNLDGSYTLHLGELEPGEICLITVRYGQTPRYEHGALYLTIPATLGPHRFSTPRDAPQGDENFDLAIDIYGNWAEATISSPTHPSMQLSQGDQAPDASQRIRVSLSRRNTLERDFALVISDIAQEAMSMAWYEHDPIQTDQVVAMLAFQPDLPARQDPLALKILVDCSSAMSPESIRTARRLQQGLIALLAPEDRFSLSRFGTTVEHHAGPLWPANEACKLAARHWSHDLSPRMGPPDLQAALQSTFEQTIQGSRADILLITQAQNSDLAAALLTAKQGPQRIFVICIGPPASSHAQTLIRQVAEVSGGVFDQVISGQTLEATEAAETSIERLLHRLRSEQRFGLTLQWPEGITPKWQSTMPHSIFDGDTVLVHAVLDQRPQGKVRLLGYGRTRTDEERPLWQRMLTMVRGSLGAIREQGRHGWRGWPHPRHHRWQETLHSIATLSATFSSAEHPGPPPVRPAATELARMVAAARYQEQQQPALAVQYQLTTRSTYLILVHPHEDAHQALNRPPTFKLRQQRMAPLPPKLNQPTVAQATPQRQEPIFTAQATGAETRLPIRPLSPWEFSRVFEQRQPNDWPTTLQGLRDMGLGKGVITWLVCHLSEGPAGDIDVAAGIHAFLTFFAHPLTRQALHQGHAIPATHPLRQHPDPRLARMSRDFSGMTGENWPVL
ncbi:hypothetical protein [Leptothrix ochracea]|uniref:hypothetical protein n=2 Tax=Leptothrix ochracea TaxID=735331 RepID=UPI0034E210F9